MSIALGGESINEKEFNYRYLKCEVVLINQYKYILDNVKPKGDRVSKKKDQGRSCVGDINWTNHQSLSSNCPKIWEKKLQEEENRIWPWTKFIIL